MAAQRGCAGLLAVAAVLVTAAHAAQTAMFVRFLGVDGTEDPWRMEGMNLFSDSGCSVKLPVNTATTFYTTKLLANGEEDYQCDCHGGELSQCPCGDLQKDLGTCNSPASSACVDSGSCAAGRCAVVLGLPPSTTLRCVQFYQNTLGSSRRLMDTIRVEYSTNCDGQQGGWVSLKQQSMPNQDFRIPTNIELADLPPTCSAPGPDTTTSEVAPVTTAPGPDTTTTEVAPVTTAPGPDTTTEVATVTTGEPPAPDPTSTSRSSSETGTTNTENTQYNSGSEAVMGTTTLDPNNCSTSFTIEFFKVFFNEQCLVNLPEEPCPVDMAEGFLKELFGEVQWLSVGLAPLFLYAYITAALLGNIPAVGEKKDGQSSGADTYETHPPIPGQQGSATGSSGAGTAPTKKRTTKATRIGYFFWVLMQGAVCLFQVLSMLWYVLGYITMHWKLSDCFTMVGKAPLIHLTVLPTAGLQMAAVNKMAPLFITLTIIMMELANHYERAMEKCSFIIGGIVAIPYLVAIPYCFLTLSFAFGIVFAPLAVVTLLVMGIVLFLLWTMATCVPKEMRWLKNNWQLDFAWFVDDEQDTTQASSVSSSSQEPSNRVAAGINMTNINVEDPLTIIAGITIVLMAISPFLTLGTILAFAVYGGMDGGSVISWIYAYCFKPPKFELKWPSLLNFEALFEDFPKNVYETVIELTGFLELPPQDVLVLGITAGAFGSLLNAIRSFILSVNGFLYSVSASKEDGEGKCGIPTKPVRSVRWNFLTK